MFENIEMGDKVWDFVHGWGDVAGLSPLDNFPIKVKFKSTFYTYNYSGSEFEGHAQTLFWDEIKFKMPEKPKPKFKIGDWVHTSNGFIQVKSMDGLNTIRTMCGNSIMNIENLNPWKPQEGEWCVFYNDNESYVIAKFERSMDSKHYCKGRGWFGNIAPLKLIETLKGD